jgi:hypothetical protein
MKIQSKTIILLLLLILSLITLLSYFFFTKYKFLLEYIDNRIDLKHQKMIEKYNLNQVYENNKEHEQKYLENLKDNLENFNNTLSKTNFIDHFNELSDIEEEYSNEENSEENSEEEKEEEIAESAELVKEEEKEEEEEEGEKEIILELPNLDSLEDSVDDYIKQILEKQEDIDLSNLIDEEEEKKKLL